ncbi:MAG: phosphate regulon sensor histidine kinase PhoR [Betaproteobacteria bacterium]|nr:phosphate regulon sensor histidine kinase PhoR [Betaproteobacteria bacterium]
MDNFWFQPALRIGAIALAGVAVMFWDVTAGMLVIALGLLGLVVVQLIYLQRLQRWLDDPEAAVIPDGWGAWNSVFSTLYRARRREEANRKGLTSALDRFRRAAGALPDGVLLLDAGFHIEWCNAAAESHFGIELERDRGLLFTHIARHPVLADYLALDVGALPVTMRPTQNQSQILSLQLIPYGEADRLLLSRDVTAIERAETIRRDFVANVSHELRTPLTVLTGFLELIADDVPREPAVARRQTQLMREQAERMARLVEDLLTLSRLESDSVVAPGVRVDVPGMLEQLHVDAGSLSAGRHTLRWEVDPHLAVTGSEQELRSVVSNLVSNAIRYTPAGGEVEVTWRLANGQAEFAVRDSGIGIAPEHIPRLTERFYRVDTGRSRETGGTGLGLAIVKHVLARHQARLEIASETAAGSTFRAVFPARRVRHVDVVAPATDAAAATG